MSKSNDIIVEVDCDNEFSFSEYSYNLSDIQQLDGNDSISMNPNQSSSANRSSNFRLIEVNINSLKGKKDEFKVMLEQKKPDCVVIVETKLNETYNNSEFFDLNKWNVIVKKIS